MKIFAFLLFSLTCQLIFAIDAFAYLDPGTGSMVIQVLLGAIAAVSVTATLLWKRIVLFFKGVFGKTSKDDPLP